MHKAGTFRCTLLTPVALVAAVVSAAAGNWGYLAMSVAFVAFDLRITFKDAP